MRDYDFVFITQRFQNINLPCVKNIKGNWNDNILSDEEVRNIMNSHSYFNPIKANLSTEWAKRSFTVCFYGDTCLYYKNKGFWDNTFLKI